MSDQQQNATETEQTIPEVAAVKVQTPKRTPSKRKSAVERAQAESEQLLKSMGIDIEATTPGRRTRSGGARSSPVVQESPAKKAKTTTPRGKKGKKLMDTIVDEKNDVLPEPETKENSVEEPQKEEQKEENEIPQENHDQVDSQSTEVIPEEKVEEVVQKEEVAVAVPFSTTETHQPEPVEAMEVDSVPKIVTTPPEPEAAAEPEPEPVVEQPPVVEVISAAAQENELNTAEEIKQNENSVVVVEESKVVVEVPEQAEPKIEDNNHGEKQNSLPVEQTESSGHCQTEAITEPPAANSDIVQTPQSCN